jgi:hypothetical protein
MLLAHTVSSTLVFYFFLGRKASSTFFFLRLRLGCSWHTKCLSVYYFLKTPHKKRSHSCNSLPPFLPPSPHLTCTSIYVSLARSPARRSPPPRALSGGRQQLLHVELCVCFSLARARARTRALSDAASRARAEPHA